MYKSLRYLSLPCALAIALVGCSPQDNDVANADSVLKSCPGFVETGEPPLVHSAECGQLTVKENSADLNSKEITIEILRLPAISPAAEPDPLFLIQGGPGGSSIEMASFIHSTFADVRKNRDLIFVDQRGTGKSNPLHCKALENLDMQLPHAEMMDKYLSELRECAQGYGDSLSNYTTFHAVQDLDAVRAALGYQQINVWGVSYGTRVALEYARRFPQATRTLILDGVAPTQIALSKFMARDTLAAFTTLNTECQAQAECANVFGDLLAQAETIHSRLRAAEAEGQPIVVDYAHPAHQKPAQLILRAEIFAQLIFSALYSRDLTVLLSQAIHEAANNNYRLLAALFALSMEQSQKMNIAYALHFSVICNEDWHYVTNADVETAETFFGLNPLKDRARVCDFWPSADLPDDYFEQSKSDTPALLLSGNYDPVTPKSWADAAAKNLANATHLVARGGNHGISTEGCVPQIIAQFIEQGAINNINTSCVDNIQSLPLALGAHYRQIKEDSSDNAGATHGPESSNESLPSSSSSSEGVAP